MTLPLLNENKIQFVKVLTHLKEELASLRPGRANAAILDRVEVMAYDSKMPLKGLANISVPDAKTIAIEPWDASLLREVEKALVAADLGTTPNIQGKTIRLVMPSMTEDRRKELAKVVREKAEASRKAIRAVREKVRDRVVEMESNRELTEDDRFKAQDELDKITKDFTEKIEKMVEEKEKEMMTI